MYVCVCVCVCVCVYTVYVCMYVCMCNSRARELHNTSYINVFILIFSPLRLQFDFRSFDLTAFWILFV